MKSVLLFLTLILSSFAVQAAESVTTITITTAQQDAETMARTGVLRHCGRSGGILEGIGMSSVSADAALRRCCYWGRPYREIGIARSRTGVWYAVVRYR
jgi:hypothetical protein